MNEFWPPHALRLATRKPASKQDGEKTDKEGKDSAMLSDVGQLTTPH